MAYHLQLFTIREHLEKNLKKLGQNEVAFNRFLFYTKIDISTTQCIVQMALLTRLGFWANQLEIIISAYIGGKHF